MKIGYITRTEEEVERCDFREAIEIKVDGVTKFSVMDGEPEDSNISRDFSDCHSVVNLMKLAFEAGKKGEELLIEEIETDDI